MTCILSILGGADRTGRPAPKLMALAGVAVIALGCVTQSEGDRLASEGQRNRRGVRALEQKVTELQAQLGALQELVESSTQTVTRTSADLSLELRATEQRLEVLDGQIAELNQTLSQAKRDMEGRFNTMAQKSGMDIPVNPKDIPSSKAEHFQQAFRFYKNRDYARARSLFREYVSRYSGDEYADNAQYWVGATLLKQDKPAKSLGEYRKVISTYAQGDAVDEALLDMAEAFFRLQACTDARAALKSLLQNHRKSSLVERARQKLKEINRSRRGACAS